MESSHSQVAQWILESSTIVVFVGAGLSTESGIPDFRSPGGVWDRYNPEDFYYQNFMASEKSREKYWQMATEMYASIREARPNPAHRAIAELEQLGRLERVITQNIDGLHFKAGNTEDRVIELHGTALFVTCLSCSKQYSRDEIQHRLLQGVKVPYCDDCGGPLKPATISFGQSMPEKETREAFEKAAEADLFVVIGSSLAVQPAASLPQVAKRNQARLVIINRDPTPLDGLADLVIRGQAGEVMAAIVGEVKNRLGI